MVSLRKRALELGATDFGESKRNGKRYYVVYDGEIIHFGSDRGSTFVDHKDENIKNAWLARHSQIKNRAGEFVINLKTSPAYWSHKILWV
jgi:hypothetical protein